MPKRFLRALVGGDKPRKPKRSLPSYDEPTPETHRRLTREEEAELALKRTVFAPGTQTLLVTLFVLTITVLPLLQLVTELRAPRTGGWLPMFDVFKTLPTTAKLKSVANVWDVWHLLPRAEEIKSAEKTLETDSVVSKWLLPRVQAVLAGRLRAGNEQVYLGRDGWLFYRPDVDYVTAPGFLTPARLKQRAHAARIQPDPLKAILQFRNQLSARGIDLLVVPIPTKPTIDGEMLSARVRPGSELQNASYADWGARLTATGVRVFDPAAALLQRKAAGGNAPAYIETDTHWQPETMEFVAQQLAATLHLQASDRMDSLRVTEKEITGRGDVARMLRLSGDDLYSTQKITIRQITNGSSLWRPSRDSDVLVLGDSFANIFSLEALGWGESAGLVEHLSHSLGGRPLDCILRNSDGAFATREMLAHELARGRDRLAGKKLVIWEFAARELAFGDWKLLDLKLGRAQTAQFFSPQPSEVVEATGTIEAVSLVPQPGIAPYRDHIMALHLTDIAIPGRTRSESVQVVVYLWSMRDNVWTPAARLRSGDRVSLRLQAWADVSAQYEQINRSEIDEPELQLEEPVWGELTNDRAK